MSITLGPFHNFDILSIEALAHFNEEKFVRLKEADGENTENKTLPGVPETWRHVVAMCKPTQMFFYQLRFKNDSFSFISVWLGRLNRCCEPRHY